MYVYNIQSIPSGFIVTLWFKCFDISLRDEFGFLIYSLHS